MCRRINATRNYRSTPKGKEMVRRQNARPEAKARKKAWRENNPEYMQVYKKAWYHRAAKEVGGRVLSLSEKMDNHQKGRFADWLLRVEHKALSNYLVDHFVAEYNTKGI